MREEENGRGEKDRKSVPPETEKGTGAEGKGRIPGWNTRHGTPEALPHEAAGKAEIPHTERRAVSQTAAGHGPRMEDAPHGGGGLSAAERRFGQLHYSHFLYLKYQMVSAEQKIIRPMAKI